MSAHIPESDWRHFKRVHQDLLQRFSQRVLDELAGILRSDEGTAHDRYLRACEHLRRRDKECARAFDDFRRSTAIGQLVVMRGMELLTDEDLAGFSQATQESVRGIASIFSSTAASPNGGPATPVRTSAVEEGPPSVT